MFCSFKARVIVQAPAVFWQAGRFYKKARAARTNEKLLNVLRVMNYLFDEYEEVVRGNYFFAVTVQ